MPQIRAVIDYMGRLIQWFQTLTGEQQANIRRWGLLAGAITAAALILPKLIAGFQAVSLAIRGVGLAMTLLTAHPLILILTAIAAVIVLIVVSTNDWKDILSSVSAYASSVFQDLAVLLKDVMAITKETVEWVGRLAGARREESAANRESWAERNLNPLRSTQALTQPTPQRPEPSPWARLMASGLMVTATAIRLFTDRLDRSPAFAPRPRPREESMPPMRGFEAVDQAYRRIAEASIKATAAYGFRSPQEQAAESLRQIYETIQRLEPQIDNFRPVVVR
jgi:hypothetical protein